MAIKNDYQKFGVTFVDAYTKITKVEYTNGVQQEWVMSEDPTVAPTMQETKVLRVSYVASTYAIEGASEPITTKQINFISEDGNDLLGDCYANLKTQEGFEDAIDA